MHSHEVWIPITMFLSVAAVIGLYFYYGSKAKNAQQETLRKLIDNGQALSPELIESIAKPAKPNPHKDFSRGILLISLGIAILLFGAVAVTDEPEFKSISFFPFALGVAFLIIHRFRPKD